MDESIRGQRFDAGGSAVGGEFQVNSLAADDQSYSSVAGSPGGDFVVVWQSGESVGDDSDLLSIQGRRFAADGSPLGDQFQVNTETPGVQRTPEVAVDGDGTFIVVWASVDSIKGQLYASDGAAAGGELEISTPVADQRQPAVRHTSDGGFIVAWESYSSTGSDTSRRSVQARRFTSDGTAIGGEFQVNTYTTGTQGRAALAIQDDGRFIVLWGGEGTGSDNDFFDVYGQRFSADAVPVGGEFQVNQTTLFGQGFPSVVHTAGGAFFVVWLNVDNPDILNFITSVRGRRFAADATPISGEFQVPTYTTGSEYFPQVVANGAGDFVVVWTGTGSDGSDTSESSVHGQRFFFDPDIFADGFESGDTGAWSSTVP